MPATVILGGQWGDEGKAKVVDYLMGQNDVVIRFQGGANAGHTVVNEDGKFAFHQIPSGLLYPQVTGIMGNGMVIDPFSFFKELEGLMTRGIDVESRLFISTAAHVVMPYHKLLDNLYETDLGDHSIGSTGKGIGPSYADKHKRRGVRMGDFLLSKEELYELVREKVAYNNQLLSLYNAPSFPPEKVASEFVNFKELISHFIVDTQELVFAMKKEGKRILLEGAQGTLLDIDHGTYPFVTSSSCTVGGSLTGSGLGPRDIEMVLGIFKAYTTRVGNGPFPTELTGGGGEVLREKGNEYGTTTGRPRRCGWLDLVAAKYAVQLNGITDIALTKLDVISGLPKVSVCIGYLVDDEELESYPVSAQVLEKCRPIYKELPGWSAEMKATSFEELEDNARHYIEMIEEWLGARISYISTGPERKNTIIRDAAYSIDK